MDTLGAGSAFLAGAGNWRQMLAYTVEQCVNVLLPPMCPICREPIGSTSGICTVCWPTLSFIEQPLCERLGTPFAYDPGPGIVSSAALARPPAWTCARGAVSFDDTARILVHALKYRDQHNTAKLMATLMARAGAEILAGADLLIPVPLYPLRLWQRRFNQSALLARHLHSAAGVPSQPHALARIRPTQAQVGLDFAHRKKNVRNAFAVPDDRVLEVAGRNCVLIDDVMTTGATAEACTAALLKAGAARVDVIVFALVLNPAGRHI